jgi:hypothetical protein
MRASEKDWASRLETRKRERAIEDLPRLRSVAQGEVLSAQLTGSPDWDAFLRVLSAKKDEAIRAVTEFQERMLDPSIPPDALSHLRMLAYAQRARLAVLEEIEGIPKVLSEQGDAARELIAKYAEDGE